MDVEKTMQFILEQQARFSSDIDVLREQSAAQNKEMREQEARFIREMQELKQAQLRQLEVVNRLVDVTAEQGQHIQHLTQAQQRTENSLNALIQVVDGLVRRP
jgi:hypothetical protein